MKPIIKWQGGKSQLMNEINNLAPKQFNRIIEPFVGGGSVFLYFEKNNSIINDANPELINVYNMCKEQPENLKQELQKIEKLFNQSQDKKDFYLLERSKDRNDGLNNLSDIERASRFIFLNKTAWNGRYRENSKKEFNIPFSGTSKISLINDTIISTIDFIHNSKIEIFNKDFEEIFNLAKPGDFIFVDPPYDPINKTELNYTSEGFGKKDQERLKIKLDLINEKGIKFLVCNSNTEYIKNLYKNYKIHIVYAKRSINVDGAKRGKIKEVMITNY